MSNKLENALVDAIEKASGTLESAGQFIMSELPDVVQQALTWYFLESLIFFVVGILMLFASPKIIKYQFGIFVKDGNIKESMSYGYGCLDVWPTILAASLIAIDVTAFVVALCNASNITWLKIWMAPKLWLVEFAAKMAG